MHWLSACSWLLEQYFCSWNRYSKSNQSLRGKFVELRLAISMSQASQLLVAVHIQKLIIHSNDQLFNLLLQSTADHVAFSGYLHNVISLAKSRAE